MNDHVLIASAGWVLLTAGVLAWRRLSVQRALVLAGIVVDVALVLHLQITRGAVQQALGFELGALHQAHIAVSTLAVVLYVPVLWHLVRITLRPDTGSDGLRFRRFLLAAYTLRTLGLALMFAAVVA